MEAGEGTVATAAAVPGRLVVVEAALLLYGGSRVALVRDGRIMAENFSICFLAFFSGS